MQCEYHGIGTSVFGIEELKKSLGGKRRIVAYFFPFDLLFLDDDEEPPDFFFGAATDFGF